MVFVRGRRRFVAVCVLFLLLQLLLKRKDPESIVGESLVVRTLSSTLMMMMLELFTQSMKARVDAFFVVCLHHGSAM